MSDVKKMELFKESIDETKQLLSLKEELVDVLERINKIRPVQFLDWESGYVYNFLGLMDRPTDERVFICVSGDYDNLPSRVENPLHNSRGRKLEPYKVKDML